MALPARALSTFIIDGDATSLETLGRYGVQRREASAEEGSARDVVKHAILVAAGAAVPNKEIVKIASRVYQRIREIPQQAYSRQGVYQFLREHDAESHTVFVDAGRPPKEAAEEALAEATSAAIPLIVTYGNLRDTVVSLMWCCVAAGRGPAAVVEASGFAESTAYRYLDMRPRFARIRKALNELLNERPDSHTAENPQLASLGLRNWMTGVVVNNFREDDDTQRRLRAALATVGEGIDPGAARGTWALVKPL